MGVLNAIGWLSLKNQKVLGVTSLFFVLTCISRFSCQQAYTELPSKGYFMISNQSSSKILKPNLTKTVLVLMISHQVLMGKSLILQKFPNHCAII